MVAGTRSRYHLPRRSRSSHEITQTRNLALLVLRRKSEIVTSITLTHIRRPADRVTLEVYRLDPILM